jgi:hypothetical protein
VQFSTDQPLTLLIRYEVSEIRRPGTFEETRDAIRGSSASAIWVLGWTEGRCIRMKPAAL